MKTLFHRNTGIAAFAALVIVGLTGLTLERGHAGMEARGVIEVGQPLLLAAGDRVVAQLPAVTVYGARETRVAGAVEAVGPQG